MSDEWSGVNLSGFNKAKDFLAIATIYTAILEGEILAIHFWERTNLLTVIKSNHRNNSIRAAPSCSLFWRTKSLKRMWQNCTIYKPLYGDSVDSSEFSNLSHIWFNPLLLAYLVRNRFLCHLNQSQPKYDSRHFWSLQRLLQSIQSNFDEFPALPWH